MITELRWFFEGDTNIRYLVQNGCNIWNGDVQTIQKELYEWDLDDYLTQEEFIQKIKDDEMFGKNMGRTRTNIR